MSGAASDLLRLTEIARDRSAAGRARLFALLAALLCDRWGQLTPRERLLLAELVALLLPRAEAADRDRLTQDLTRIAADDRTAVPDCLHPLLSSPSASEVQTAPRPTPPPAPPPVIAAAPIRVTVRRVTPSAQTPPAQTPPAEAPAAQAPAAPQKRLHVTVSPMVKIMRAPQGAAGAILEKPEPDRPGLDQVAPDKPAPEKAAETDEGHAVTESATTAETMLPDGGDNTAAVLPAVLPPPVLPLPITAPPMPVPVVPQPSAAPRPDSALDQMLSAPRINPHRLTPQQLGEALDQGDLPRFEVMLAHLCNIRAPLLRRLLREGGNESLAILARAAGFAIDDFLAQWQRWRRQAGAFDRLSTPPDRRDIQRMGAFFAALSDQQVHRLIQRWRSDGNRLFADQGVAPTE